MLGPPFRLWDRPLRANELYRGEPGRWTPVLLRGFLGCSRGSQLCPGPSFGWPSPGVASAKASGTANGRGALG